MDRLVTLADVLQGTPLPNSERLRMQKQAMAGRALAPADEALLAADMPRLQEGSGRLASITNIPQTGQSLTDLYENPSIASGTKAGVDVALTALRPGLAGLLMAGGLGASAAKDAGLLATEAAAGPKERDRARAANAERDAAKAKGDAEVKIRDAEIRAQERAAAVRKQEADEALAREGAARDRETYDRAVKQAEGAYQAGLDTNRRFGDTSVGQLFEKFGPVAPGAVGMGAGFVTGAGLRGAGVTSKAALYGVPTLSGMLSGLGAAHWPQVYDANYAPNVNPSYAAAENYVREAPTGDPRAGQLKALMQDGTLSRDNPVRTTAERDLYDPTKFAERSALGIFEGAVAGLGGSEIIPATKFLGQAAGKAAGNAIEGVASVPGRLRAGASRGDTAAANAAVDQAKAEGRLSKATEALGMQRQQQSMQRQQLAGSESAAAEAARRSAGGVAAGKGSPQSPGQTPLTDPAQLQPPQPATATNPQKTLPPPAQSGDLTTAGAREKRALTRADKDDLWSRVSGLATSGMDPAKITADQVGANLPRKLVDGYLEGFKKAHASAPQGASRSDALRWARENAGKLSVAGAAGAAAVADDTSPTGHRNADGTFAVAP